MKPQPSLWGKGTSWDLPEPERGGLGSRGLGPVDTAHRHCYPSTTPPSAGLLAAHFLPRLFRTLYDLDCRVIFPF